MLARSFANFLEAWFNQRELFPGESYPHSLTNSHERIPEMKSIPRDKTDDRRSRQRLKRLVKRFEGAKGSPESATTNHNVELMPEELGKYSYFRKECLQLAVQKVEIADLKFLLEIAKGLKTPLELEMMVHLFARRRLSLDQIK